MPRRRTGAVRRTATGRAWPWHRKGDSDMTILGKILAIVNFVFSLVTVALIVMVFVTRTNWKAGFDRVNQSYTVERANAAAYAQEAQAVKTTYDARLAQANQEIERLKAAVEQEKQATTAQKTELDKIREQAAATDMNLQKATQELKRRELEVASLTQVTEAKNAKINDLEKTNQEYRDRAVSAEINYNTEHQRNVRLLAENERLNKDNERLQQNHNGNGRTSTVARRPPEDVKGKILEVDSRSGLATISIGTDSGVNVGNTLEVYHLTPKPEYVGTVRVVDANFKQAVVRPVLPLRTALQKNDVVASRILASSR